MVPCNMTMRPPLPGRLHHVRTPNTQDFEIRRAGRIQLRRAPLGRPVRVPCLGGQVLSGLLHVRTPTTPV